jgi:uncharacterized phage infection (PIP) family protein YhgE
MKKLVQALTSALLCVVMAFSAASAASAPASPPEGAAEGRTANSREEVVYANLTAGGAVKDVYVVSLLTVDGGAVTDYGDYASVTNLTDTSPLVLAGGRVSFTSEAGIFYYQGVLNHRELPWLIDVAYLLDGVEVGPEALAGRTGHVEIRIAASSNPATDPSYFDNYMLTVSVTLDAALCRNIRSTGGMAANAGSNKLITFMALPGQPAEFTVEADAVGFAMPGIEFSALPLSLSIQAPDTSDMKSELTQLTDAISALSSGVKKLEGGCLDLKNGAAELKDGSVLFAGGLGELSRNAAGLLGGSAQIKEALSSLAEALGGAPGAGAASNQLNIAGLTQLPGALEQLAAGLTDMSAGLQELRSAYAPAYKALADAVGQIPGQTLPQEALGGLYADNPEKKDLLDALMAYYQGGATVKATFDKVRPAFEAVGQALDETIAGADRMAQTLSGMAQQLRASLSGSDTAAQLAELGDGLTALSARYGQFHEGLTAFTAGVSALDSQYAALDDGLGGIAGGASKLYDGVARTGDGVRELDGAVSDLPDKVDEEISKLMDKYDKSGFKPVSFVSEKNVNTVSVQFVMKTAPIEVPEAPAAAGEDPAPENFWTRFLALFR